MHEAVLRVFAGAADAALTDAQRAEVAARQGGRCFGCAEPLTARLCYGHLVPRSRGGGHELANRIALCLPCEAARGNRLPSAYEAVRQAALCENERTA